MQWKISTLAWKTTIYMGMTHHNHIMKNFFTIGKECQTKMSVEIDLFRADFHVELVGKIFRWNKRNM